MTEILIASAAASNYEGMDALVGEDGRVYLGRSENYCPGDGEAPAFYDNSDNSLQLISDNIKMFHFLYGEGWPVSQRQMRRERCFTKAEYRVCQPAGRGAVPLPSHPGSDLRREALCPAQGILPYAPGAARRRPLKFVSN